MTLAVTFNGASRAWANRGGVSDAGNAQPAPREGDTTCATACGDFDGLCVLRNRVSQFSRNTRTVMRAGCQRNLAFLAETRLASDVATPDPLTAPVSGSIHSEHFPPSLYPGPSQRPHLFAQKHPARWNRPALRSVTIGYGDLLSVSRKSSPIYGHFQRTF